MDTVKAIRITENVQLKKPQLSYFSLLKPLFKKGSFKQNSMKSHPKTLLYWCKKAVTIRINLLVRINLSQLIDAVKSLQ